MDTRTTSVCESQSTVANFAAGMFDPIKPNCGPHVGGNHVTITASTPIGNGQDIFEVLFDEEPAEIISQTATTVTVIAPEGKDFGRILEVTVRSISFGLAHTPGYLYNKRMQNS